MLSFIKKIDGWLFKKKVSLTKERVKEFVFFTNLNRILGSKYIVRYSKLPDNPLTILSQKYGSDKGFCGNSSKNTENHHSYTEYYHSILNRSRYSVKNLFECGIGTNDASFPCAMENQAKPGASLRMWKEYFPKAKIFGGDIDKKILFSEARIKTFHLDQTDPRSIQKMWNQTKGTLFDIMIDDGLHVFEAGLCLFENSLQMLSRQGVYFIEDVKVADLDRYARAIPNKGFNIEIISFFQPGTAVTDNNLIKIYS